MENNNLSPERMDEMYAKAQVLIEALPYIRDFNDKIVVVKYGGSAMLDERLEKSMMKDVALLKLVGMHPVIVHGGGKEISKWLELSGKKSEFVEGLRVTDADTMEVAEMVLGKVNKKLVALIERLGVKAAGICGKDGATLKVDKKLVNGQDIGYVGQIKEVDTSLIRTLLKNDFIPVISPIGLDDAFKSYNINADDAACAIAEALGAEKLAFMTDVAGVCRDPEDKSTLISAMTLAEAYQMIDDGYIGGGMLPKIKNCIEAVENGVKRVYILDGRKEHCLLLEFFTKKGVGTAILHDDASFYAHERS